MNILLRMLTGGNLASDGRANEVADMAIENPELFVLLIDGLSEKDDLIRARTAHAMERIARSHPEMVDNLYTKFIGLALTDQVPMVRWHMAMIFADLPIPLDRLELTLNTLYEILADSSVFVISWAMVSLAIIGKEIPSRRDEIYQHLVSLSNSKSKAIQSKVLKCLAILTDDHAAIPPGWIKTRD